MASPGAEASGLWAGTWREGAQDLKGETAAPRVHEPGVPRLVPTHLLRGPSCSSGRGSALWGGLAPARRGPTGLCPPADNHPGGRTHAAICRGLGALGGSRSGAAMGGPPAPVCGGSSSAERDFPRWPSKAVSRLQRSPWLPVNVGGPPARGTGETGGRGWGAAECSPGAQGGVPARSWQIGRAHV